MLSFPSLFTSPMFPAPRGAGLCLRVGEGYGRVICENGQKDNQTKEPGQKKSQKFVEKHIHCRLFPDIITGWFFKKIKISLPLILYKTWKKSKKHEK